MHSQTIEQDKFLILSANLLHKALIEPSRTDSKRVYHDLHKGVEVQLATVAMGDTGQARFTLALEHSEFRGRLNFGAFQASVKMLLNSIAEAVNEKRTVRVFNAQGDSGAMMFGVTGITFEAQQPNVMVLAASPSPESNITGLQLMYLDPDQFTESESAQMQ